MHCCRQQSVNAINTVVVAYNAQCSRRRHLTAAAAAAVHIDARVAEDAFILCMCGRLRGRPPSLHSHYRNLVLSFVAASTPTDHKQH